MARREVGHKGDTSLPAAVRETIRKEAIDACTASNRRAVEQHTLTLTQAVAWYWDEGRLAAHSDQDADSGPWDNPAPEHRPEQQPRQAYEEHTMTLTQAMRMWEEQEEEDHRGRQAQSCEAARGPRQEVPNTPDSRGGGNTTYQSQRVGRHR